MEVLDYPRSLLFVSGGFAIDIANNAISDLSPCLADVKVLKKELTDVPD